MCLEVWDLFLEALEPIRGYECQDETLVWNTLHSKVGELAAE
jgi:hypothetical protein